MNPYCGTDRIDYNVEACVCDLILTLERREQKYPEIEVESTLALFFCGIKENII